MRRWLVVDGSTHPGPDEGTYQGDGEFPPFVVFDVCAQENIAGPYPFRWMAELRREAFLADERGEA